MNAAPEATPAAPQGSASPSPVYKSSELGTIPVDWRVFDIGDLRPFVTSGSRGWAQYYSDLGAPFLRITNMSRESVYLDISDLKLVDLPAGQSEADRTQLKYGDVLISITADIGIVGYVDERISKPAYINQHIALVRFDSTETEPKFISYLLASHFPQRVFRGLTDQGAKAGMSLLTVRKLKVLQPEIEEQRTIAVALSDADALIVALDKLIAKKLAMKLATMQQLLTGKIRLPGFGPAKTDSDSSQTGVLPQGWVVKALGNLARLYQPETIPARQFASSGYPVYGANGFVGFHSQYNHDTWQVTVTCRGSTCGTVNRTVDRCWITGNAMVANCEETPELDKLFFFYLLSNQDLSICITGTGQPQIVRAPLSAFELTFPHDVNEQRAIASVLSDMDAEIGVLELRRDKTNAIKQGMMQELLTGRVRLL